MSGLSEGIAWLKGSRSNINTSYTVTCEPVNHPLSSHPAANPQHQPVLSASSSQQQQQHGRPAHNHPPAAGLPPPTPRSARTPHRGLDGGLEPYTPKIMINAGNNHHNPDCGGSNMKRRVRAFEVFVSPDSGAASVSGITSSV